MSQVAFSVLILAILFLAVDGLVDDSDLNVYDVGVLGELRVDVAKRRRYLLYDVNPGEGFNLRRDVYIRVAALAKKLLIYDDWVLVLPPWGDLYHWKSSDIGEQHRIAWSKFFDVSSLNLYTTVIEMKQYLKEIGERRIDQVFYLQHYQDMFEDGKWEEKYEMDSCRHDGIRSYHQIGGNKFSGFFWGFKNMLANRFSCVSLQGQASTLIPLILDCKSTSIMLDRAEIMLHDVFGDSNYWRVRRSMRFAKDLRDAGDKFRLKHLNSSDLTDGTEIPQDWREVKPSNTGSAVGGPYIAAHLRRQDFLFGRAEQVPSVEFAAKQLLNISKDLKISRIFIATDAYDEEFEELKRHLPGAIRFVPTMTERKRFKDGGVAIIDQWICSHARYFTGTYESTFSFRIQEEREILGFHADKTFNRLCGDKESECEQPSRWRIVY